MRKIKVDTEMEFRKQVELPVGQKEIRHSDKLMLLGSCFATNMSKLLEDNKFSCLLNPFGVLYNPMSIAEALSQLLENKRYAEEDLFFDGGLWGSLMHHSSFSSADKEQCLFHINDYLQQGIAFLRQADWLILTFGTARVYEWKTSGKIVGNCHKLPSHCFHRRLLEVEEIVSVYQMLLERLKKINPQLTVLFTVSPIRHAKDGMHGNQISKSTLLLAVDKLCEVFPFCHYFPSYEIMMDELRDYRFYADDMLHPSGLAVEYIWECFGKTYFSADTFALLNEWKSIQKGVAHRPFNPDSEAYQCFLRQILLKISRLKEKFPYLDLQNEETICQVQLKK